MGLMEDIAEYHNFQGEDDLKHGMERGLFRILSLEPASEVLMSISNWIKSAGIASDGETGP